MKKLLLALCALSLSTPVLAKGKEPPPPAPAVEPDWAAVRMKAEALLKKALFDPGSAQIVWTEGFRWGYVKSAIGGKDYVWVACGTLNAKNRMGGYVGASDFYAAVRTDGSIYAESESLRYPSCLGKEHVEPQAALRDTSASPGAPSVADELTKLAALRDKGIITPAEFDQQKAKLLAK